MFHYYDILYFINFTKMILNRLGGRVIKKVITYYGTLNDTTMNHVMINHD